MLLVLHLTAALLLLCGCTKKPLVHSDFQLPHVPATFINRAKPTPVPKYWKKRVLISIGPSTPVKQMIQEIATAVGASVTMGDVPDLVGITYNAKNIPFLVALKTICRLAKWKISINKVGDISISKDEPYFYTHEVAFLSVLRKIKLISTINAVNKEKQEHDGVATESESTLDLWNEIETNLLFLLGNDKSKYSLNKQGGMILIKATQAEHEKVASFLDVLHDRITAQVLIEAKIVEVILKDRYKNGIEWDTSIVYNADRTGMFDKPVAIFENLVNSMNFLAHFGDLRTISNPRAVVLNNQHALFKEVTNNVYFKISSAPVRDHAKGKKEVSVALNSVASVIPTGIVLVVHPSIDFNTHEITLSIKPVISGVSKVEPDPAVSILGGKLNSGMPVVKEKTIETVVRIMSNKVAILGGLTSGEMQPGVFGISKGKFIANQGSTERRELVMVVTASILKGEKRGYSDLPSFSIRGYEEVDG